MKESEERSSNIDEQKARIRQRYKGIDPEELEVIPALPPEDIFKTEKKLREDQKNIQCRRTAENSGRTGKENRISGVYTE